MASPPFSPRSPPFGAPRGLGCPLPRSRVTLPRTGTVSSITAPPVAPARTPVPFYGDHGDRGFVEAFRGNHARLLPRQPSPATSAAPQYHAAEAARGLGRTLGLGLGVGLLSARPLAGTFQHAAVEPQLAIGFLCTADGSSLANDFARDIVFVIYTSLLHADGLVHPAARLRGARTAALLAIGFVVGVNFREKVGYRERPLRALGLQGEDHSAEAAVGVARTPGLGMDLPPLVLEAPLLGDYAINNAGLPSPSEAATSARPELHAAEAVGVARTSGLGLDLPPVVFEAPPLADHAPNARTLLLLAALFHGDSAPAQPDALTGIAVRLGLIVAGLRGVAPEEAPEMRTLLGDCARSSYDA